MNIAFKKFLSPHILEKIVLSIFAVAGLGAILNHAMWRDEMMGWTVARDSNSLAELYSNAIPSGHPIIWYLLLFITKSIAETPAAMQVLHWGLGTIAMVVFWRFAPFQKYQKVLYTFGYFPIYEYFIISRMYVLVILFSFLFCSFYTLRRKSYIPLAICLGLLANSHAYAFFIALSLTLILFVELLWHREQKQCYFQHHWYRDLGFSVVILLLSYGFAIYTMGSAADSVSVTVDLLKMNGRDALRVLGRILGGYIFLIPNSKRWLDLCLCGALSLGLISSIILYLRRSPVILVFYVVSTSAMAAFNYYIHIGSGSRHEGFYFIILIIAMWLSHSTHKPEPSTKTSQKSTKKWLGFYPSIWVAILTVHLIIGLYLFTIHLRLPYSASKVTAQYIRDQGLQDEFIVGSPDTVMTPLSGYLNRPFYYPQVAEQGTFALWDERVYVPQNKLFKQIKQLFRTSDRPQPLQKVLLILNKPLSQSDRQTVQQDFNLEITAITQFEESWKDTERYYLYWVEQDNKTNNRK